MGVNNFDFFELVGLKNISQQEKNKLTQEISEIAWKKFILEKLERILSEKDLVTVNEMAERDEKAGKIMGFIAKKIPDFKKSLAEFTVEVKVDMLNKQFDNMIEDVRGNLLSVNDDVQKSSLDKKEKMYLKAKEFVEKSQWGNLHNLMMEIQP